LKDNKLKNKIYKGRMRKLTGKQQAFTDEYCVNGQNGLQAAKAAKYKGNDNVLAQMAHKLVRNGKVREAIDSKLAKMKAESIATRQQRQQFWTQVYQDENAEMSSRLRASELLGKSEADFTENIKQTGEGLEIVINEPKRPQDGPKLAKGA